MAEPHSLSENYEKTRSSLMEKNWMRKLDYIIGMDRIYSSSGRLIEDPELDFDYNIFCAIIVFFLKITNYGI